jgi:deazaflavin-dependent oxidoreductase (nitroreductase family)
VLDLVVIVVASFAALWFVVVPVFERFAPPRTVQAYQRLTMPLFRVLAGYSPGFGIVETIGRRTGRRHRVPVGGRVSGDSFWLVAGVGRRANYVRNIEADPRVRVKVYGRWRPGTAHLCPDDDARKRMLRISPLNGLFLWVAGGDQLTIRIELSR